MSESASLRGSFPDIAIDAIVGILLVGFVGFLFLGYLDPDFPYDPLATVPLLGSLAVLYSVNRKADRIARSVPPPSND